MPRRLVSELRAAGRLAERAVLVMLPTSILFAAGILVGVWVLRTLDDPEIEAAFEAG